MPKEKMMDRKSYKLPFTKTGYLQWVCPTCGKGVLRIKKDFFHTEETRESKKAHSHEEWDPEWIEYIYSCLLECSNNECQDQVYSSGVGFVDFDLVFDDNGDAQQDYTAFYRPKYFVPHLKIFKYPVGTPEEVSEEIEASFELFFCNPPSASNHVRIALENLLTHMKVKRYDVRNRKRIYLRLHRRIEMFPTKYADLKELFFAIKWLGNAGSHSHKSISSDDVLDAYEIMEEILKEIFEKKSKRVKKLAKKIVKKKGPKK
jgi:hypothetical protein